MSSQLILRVRELPLILLLLRPPPTWIDFPVGGDTVGLNEGLEAVGELVGTVEGGWRDASLNHVQDGLHSRATLVLIRYGGTV